MSTTLLGIRTVIYPAPDLQAGKRWFTGLLGVDPYFDQPFYVGYRVAGYELGLDPHADPALGAQSYWGVADIEVALAELVAAGARLNSAAVETGDGIKVASVLEPGGSFFGLIENPAFLLPPPPTEYGGPGR
jgi:predicted enzyme related to lactoylglutathione lyase